jgi:hypothetical protein
VQAERLLGGTGEDGQVVLVVDGGRPHSARRPTATGGSADTSSGTNPSHGNTHNATEEAFLMAAIRRVCRVVPVVVGIDGDRHESSERDVS